MIQIVFLGTGMSACTYLIPYCAWYKVQVFKALICLQLDYSYSNSYKCFTKLDSVITEFNFEIQLFFN